MKNTLLTRVSILVTKQTSPYFVVIYKLWSEGFTSRQFVTPKLHSRMFVRFVPETDVRLPGAYLRFNTVNRHSAGGQRM